MVNRAPADRRTPPPIVDGLVLAAGRSRRMRQPKALLPVDGASFLERAIGVLREGGCREVVVVVRAGDAELARRARQAGGRVIVNPAAESETIDSIRLGLAVIGADAAAAALLPVDHPLVRPATVAAVIAAFRQRGAPIVRPTYCGVPGHPGLFARRVFPGFHGPDLPHGAHSVIDAHGGEVDDVACNDPGVTADIDTPDDYRRLVAGAC